MTIRYEITKAVHKRQYDRIHPCLYQRYGCNYVRLDDNKGFVLYALPKRTLNKVSHHTCPEHKGRFLDDVVDEA